MYIYTYIYTYKYIYIYINSRSTARKPLPVARRKGVAGQLHVAPAALRCYASCCIASYRVVPKPSNFEYSFGFTKSMPIAWEV